MLQVAEHFVHARRQLSAQGLPLGALGAGEAVSAVGLVPWVRWGRNFT